MQIYEFFPFILSMEQLIVRLILYTAKMLPYENVLEYKYIVYI